MLYEIITDLMKVPRFIGCFFLHHTLLREHVIKGK